MVLHLSDDQTYPNYLNLVLHPDYQILPGLSFKYFKGKTAYRIDADYAKNYTNSKVMGNDSSYFSEANHSKLDVQFGLEHKFLPGRIYPYCFGLISVGYHNALGNSYGKRKPTVFDFEMFDINVGLNGGYGFYFFLIKQLSVSAEFNVLFLNTWNNFTVATSAYQETWNNTNFTVRAGTTLGLNYYFNQK